MSIGGFRLFRHVFEEAVWENAKNKERYVMEKLGFSVSTEREIRDGLRPTVYVKSINSYVTLVTAK